jgi:hemolysin III
VDAVVHFVGVFFGLIGAIVLMLSSIGGLPFRDIAGLGVYSLGLIGMFTASASYHLVRRPSLKEWFRRVDHAVIFVMIAGSYTPFALKIGGETGTLILAAVWGIALLGVAVKLFFPRKLEKISVLIYLAQGWCIVFALDRLVAAVPSSGVDLLVIGGCIYSAGVIFHLLTRLPFHNAIWHLFVLGGASLQYASIYVTVIPQG